MKKSLLETKITKAAQDYYEGHESISDAEFDKLVDELRIINPNSSLLKTIGWGFNVNKIKNTKVEHDYGIVGSLDKVHEVSEIPYNDMIISAKLDGSTCVAYYVKGKLIVALTRGNGVVGIDRTEKYSYIVSKYNLRIPETFTGAIRGEIVFSNEQWNKYKQKYPDAKLPRNVSTGLFMGDEITEDLSYIDFIPYKIHGSTTTYITYVDILNELDNFGFNVVPHSSSVVTKDDNLNSLLQKLFTEYSAMYPIDGLVLNSGVAHKQNGLNDYTDIAFKFPAEDKVTTVKQVIWQLSRNNILIPVVDIEPVMLSGALVSRCTGFNYKYILDNKVDKGAQIRIRRSGEVIPDIQEVVLPSLEQDLPTKCPVCGCDLAVEGVHIKCINPNCDNITYSKLYTWIEKIGVRDLLGVGPALINTIIDKLKEKNITSVEQLYENDLSYIKIYLTPANKNKFTTILENLKKPATPEEIIVASNIYGLGGTNAKKIAKIIYNHIQDDFDLVNNLTKVDGIGDFVINSVLASRKMLQRYFTLVEVKLDSEPVVMTAAWQITITGALSIPRKQFEAFCIKNGVAVSDNLNKSKYLVTNNPDPSSSKGKKAKALGIPIITEKEFMEIINGK